MRFNMNWIRGFLLCICCCNTAASVPHAEKLFSKLTDTKELRNEDVVTLITSSAVQEFVFLRSRYFTAIYRFFDLFSRVDTFPVRFALRQCNISETKHFTTFTCPDEPPYILSRKCTDQYYVGAGICCKVDELLIYLLHDRPDLFAHTKFAIIGDDDTYFRVEEIMRWLSAIEGSGVNTFPIIANGELNTQERKIWHISKGCNEVHTNGWYQPAIVNHAALVRLKAASAAYGLTATCANFDVSQDVGWGPYAWLFGLYHVTVPQVIVSNRGGVHRPDLMIVHSVRHGAERDNCNNPSNFEAAARYNQQHVLGCGDVSKPILGHNVTLKDYNGRLITYDMYDVWNYFEKYGIHTNLTHGGENKDKELWGWKKVTLYPSGTMFPDISTPGDENKIKIKYVLKTGDVISSDARFEGDEVVERYIPLLLKLEGYAGTNHSRENNIVVKWKEFTMKDCQVEGVIRGK